VKTKQINDICERISEDLFKGGFSVSRDYDLMEFPFQYSERIVIDKSWSNFSVIIDGEIELSVNKSFLICSFLNGLDLEELFVKSYDNYKRISAILNKTIEDNKKAKSIETFKILTAKKGYVPLGQVLNFMRECLNTWEFHDKEFTSRDISELLYKEFGELFGRIFRRDCFSYPQFFRFLEEKNVLISKKQGKFYVYKFKENI
jgi:hypothetical protein